MKIKEIDNEWIKEKFFNELKITKKDLQTLLELDRSSLDLILLGHRGMRKLGTAAFDYLYLNLKNRKK